MSDLEKIVDVLKNIECIQNKNLSEFTSFRIGGPTDYLFIVHTVEELKQVVTTLNRYECPWMILGKGSNLLVLDSGIEGATILLKGNFLKHKILDSERFYCGAGMNLSEVSQIAAFQELSGLEFAVGIPGTFGGGIFMNAGAYDGELMRVIESVEWMNSEGDVKTIPLEECEFGYRKSIFQKEQGIILGATLCLTQKSNKEAILEKMRDLTQKRNSKQPIEWPSAGSTFKRPPGYFAGTLIQETGLCGFSYGDAQVSEKHAGFVINRGHAKAEDILQLISEIRKRVHEHAGVWLTPEVRIVGRDKDKWTFLYD